MILIEIDHATSDFDNTASRLLIKIFSCTNISYM